MQVTLPLYYFLDVIHDWVVMATGCWYYEITRVESAWTRMRPFSNKRQEECTHSKPSHNGAYMTPSTLSLGIKDRAHLKFHVSRSNGTSHAYTLHMSGLPSRPNNPRQVISQSYSILSHNLLLRVLLLIQLPQLLPKMAAW